MMDTKYIHRELIIEENYPSINVVLGFESIDRYDDIAIISAMRAVEEEPPLLNG